MPRLWNMLQCSWWIVGQSIRRCRCDAKGKTIRALARTDFFQRHLERDEQEALNAQFKMKTVKLTVRSTLAPDSLTVLVLACLRVKSLKVCSCPAMWKRSNASQHTVHPEPKICPIVAQDQDSSQKKGLLAFILIESLLFVVTLLKTGWYVDNRLNAASTKDVWLTVQHPGAFCTSWFSSEQLL